MNDMAKKKKPLITKILEFIGVTSLIALAVLFVLYILNLIF